MIRPELVRPAHHVVHPHPAAQSSPQITIQPQTQQNLLQSSPQIQQIQSAQPQIISAPTSIVGPIGHATSVIRISPASSTYLSPASFHPVIVDPTHLVPLLPPSTAINHLAPTSNGNAAAHADKAPKNGISTGNIFQWHTLLPVISAPPPPAANKPQFSYVAARGCGNSLLINSSMLATMDQQQMPAPQSMQTQQQQGAQGQQNMVRLFFKLQLIFQKSLIFSKKILNLTSLFSPILAIHF